MNRLILVEGLPGTGKSTISQWIFDLLHAKDIHTVLLDEFDERIPCNFYNLAGIPRETFNTLFAAIDAPSDAILKKTENYVYLRIDKYPNDVAQELRRWDIGDEFNTYFPLCEYIKCTLEWWKHWIQDNINQPITIMDSAFLQNPINDMIFHKATDNEVKQYVSSIAGLLAPFDPVCIYLRRNNATESIEFAKAVKGPVWSAGVDGLQDMGCGDLFERRFKLEYEMLSTMEHIVCHVQGDDWSIAKTKIQNYFA